MNKKMKNIVYEELLKLSEKQRQILSRNSELKESHVTPASVTKAFTKVAEIAKLLLLNLEKYKAASDADKPKFKAIAIDLTKKKKAAEAEANNFIGQLDRDVELSLEGVEKIIGEEFDKICKPIDETKADGYSDPAYRATIKQFKGKKVSKQEFAQALAMHHKSMDESINEGVSPADMDKIKGAVEAASSFMSVGSELKKLGMKYTFATEPLPIYIIQPTPNNKVGVVNKKYATKPDFVVGDIAVGIMEGKLNEAMISPSGAKALRSGHKIKTQNGTYTITGFGSQTNATKDFEATNEKGKKFNLRVSLRGARGIQVAPAPSLNFPEKEEMLESIVNEAPMDKSFMQDWQKSCKALQNHVKHELDKIKSGKIKASDLPHGYYIYLNKSINTIKDAMDIPTHLAYNAGLTEAVNEAQFKVGDNVIVMRKDGKEYTGKVEKLNPLKLRISPSDTMVIPNAYIKDIVVNEAAGKPGMWANIHAKRKRGEAPAKPGDPDRPSEEEWKDNTSESSLTSEGTFYRLPKNSIDSDLYKANKHLQGFYDRVRTGNDVDPWVIETIIKLLNSVKKSVKKFNSAEEIKGTVYESQLVEKLIIGKEDFSFLLKLNDKELVKKLDSIRKQQAVNGKQYMDARSKGAPSSIAKQIEKEGESLANQERAVIQARVWVNYWNKNVKESEGALKESKAVKHIKLKEILENKLDTKQFIKEISAGAGLDDILSGKTTSIEGVKISKALADNIQSWIKLSPYGKKYGSFISKSKIQYLIKTANIWGINRYLDSNTKNEWSVISAKNEGTTESIKEAVNVNYWKGYHERSTKITGGNKVASAVENEVRDWNKNNEDGPSNNISSNGERKVMNLAHDFFKSAGWISSDIIQAMITQEG